MRRDLTLEVDAGVVEEVANRFRAMQRPAPRGPRVKTCDLNPKTHYEGQSKAE